MNRIQQALFKKSLSYRRCFMGDDGQLTPEAKIVLGDIAKFSGLASGPSVVSPVQRTVDVPATFQRIGRSDVLSRIWRYLKLDTSTILQLNENVND